MTSESKTYFRSFKNPQHRWYWLLFIIFSIPALILAFSLFFNVFPIANIEITSNRQDTLNKSTQLSTLNDWTKLYYDLTDTKDAPTPTIHQAIIFDNDSKLKNYVELQDDGHARFQSIINDDIYSPYYWIVRHFQEGETLEHYVRFNPRGDPIGFNVILPEDTYLTNTPVNEAQSLSEFSAKNLWNIPLDDYTLIESSSKEQPSGRIDHSFTYEHKSYSFTDAKLRLSLTYSGNLFSGLKSYFHIPQSFFQDYEHMRSFNNTLALVALFFMVIIYIIAVGGVATLYFIKHNLFLIKPALFSAMALSGLFFFSTINDLPLSWMNYDTAFSRSQFITTTLIESLSSFFMITIVYFCTFLLAEALLRTAFPERLQFWSLWSPANATHPSLFTLTFIGYFIVGYQLLYVVSFYFFTGQTLDWWNPSSALIDPNILASYLPWFNPFVNALNAGFAEEFIFRAIPLSAAIIVGRHLNQPKRWLTIGFIIQVIIFGAGHANYPALPFYARVVELIVPSILFGFLFLRFGLLTAIVSHFIFDFILMALPLYLNPSSQPISTLICLILLFLSPLWIPGYHWIRSGLSPRLLSKSKNKDWTPPQKTHSTPKQIVHRTLPLSKPLFAGIVLVIMCSIGTWFFFTPFQTDSPKQTVSKQGAKDIAMQYLKSTEPSLANAYSSIYTKQTKMKRLNQEFIWALGQKPLFDALSPHFLSPHYWIIRFAQHHGTLVEKANSYYIYVGHDGSIISRHKTQHESVIGPNLSESDAKTLVFNAFNDSTAPSKTDPLLKQYALSDFELLESTSKKHPNRTDWRFTFREKDSALSHFKKGQTRIAVNLQGDKITLVYPYLFIPDKWKRDHRESQLMTQTLLGFQKTFQLVTLIIISCACLFLSIKKGFQGRLFGKIILILSALSLCSFLISIPNTLYYLSTSKPVVFQLFQATAFPVLGKLFTSGILSIITYWILVFKRPTIPFNQALSLGLGIGTLLVGSSALIFYFSTSTIPLLASLSFSNSVVPLLAPLLATIPVFLLQTGIIITVLSYLLSITNQFTQRRWLLIVCGLLLGLMLYDLSLDYSLTTWILIFTRFLAIGGIGFWFVIRHGLNTIPIITGFIYCTDLIQQCTFSAYPGSFFAYYIAALGILGISIWYCRILSTPQK